MIAILILVVIVIVAAAYFVFTTTKKRKSPGAGIAAKQPSESITGTGLSSYDIGESRTVTMSGQFGYVSAMDNGTPLCNGSGVSDASVWIIESIKGTSLYAIKNLKLGLYLTTDAAGKMSMRDNVIDDSSRFYMETVGTRVAFKNASNGKYVSGKPDGTLVDNAPSFTEWEVFTVVNI